MTSKQAAPPILEALFETTIDRLSTDSVLWASDLPALPATLACESVVVTKSVMGYADGGSGLGYYRADVLNFFSTHRGHCALAAALACVLLHRGEANADILFTSPRSDVKALHLQRGHTDYADLGLTVLPTAFAPKLDREAALDALTLLDDRQKPRFLLTHKDDLTDVSEPWEARDHMRLATSEIGLLLLTSALIHYALHGKPERELACRAPPLTGAEVLGACSAEAYFWLPDSFAWPLDDTGERTD